MSWYQRARQQYGMFIKREYPTTLEECFQAPVEGAIYAEHIDKLRAEGAIRPWIVDNSSLTHTCWDLGSPINTVVWYFQLVGADQIRVVDCDMDLDLTPVERVARMLAKGYLYGSHFLPHDALATQKSGRTFLNERQGGGSGQLQGGSSNFRHLGRHQPPQTDVAALQLPAATLWARSRGALQLSHDSRDLDRHREG
jgi:hypothetical protein